MEQALNKAAILIFEELGFMFPTLETTGIELEAEKCAAVTVAFTGPVNGQIVLQIERVMMPIIAANMLGDDEPIDEMMQRDALGEITNVICGNALPAIAGVQAVFKLNAPEFSQMSTNTVKADAVARLELEEGRANVLLYLDK